MKAWAIHERNAGGIAPGVVFAATRPEAMMACVHSYCEAWNCLPVEAFRAIVLRRLPSHDHLAPHFGSRCLCRDYVDSVAKRFA